MKEKYQFMPEREKIAMSVRIFLPQTGIQKEASK